MKNLDQFVAEVKAVDCWICTEDSQITFDVSGDQMEKLLKIIEIQSAALGYYADKNSYDWQISMGRMSLNKSDGEYIPLEENHPVKSLTGGKKAREAIQEVEAICK